MESLEELGKLNTAYCIIESPQRHRQRPEAPSWTHGHGRNKFFNRPRPAGSRAPVLAAAAVYERACAQNVPSQAAAAWRAPA